MSRVSVSVAVYSIVLVTQCIYGYVTGRDNDDDIHYLQPGNFPGRSRVKADKPLSYLEEPDQEEFPITNTVYPEHNNRAYGGFPKENKMPKHSVVSASPALWTKNTSLDETLVNIGETSLKSVSKADLVDTIDIPGNCIKVLLRNITTQNITTMMKIVKILERLNGSLAPEIFENFVQRVFELLQTFSVRDDMKSTDVCNDSTEVTIPKSVFRPVKTMADVMALKGKKLPKAIHRQKKSFLCPLMYRTAFSVSRCWRFARMFKRRRECMRRLVIAREWAAKRKLARSSHRRPRMLSA